MNLRTALYLSICLLMAVFLGIQFTQHAPLQTQLTALLPQETAADPVFQAAEQAQEAELNQNIVIAVGSSDSETAFQTASQLADTWQQSGLFQKIDSKIEPDLAQLRQSVRLLGAAVLPEAQLKQIRQQPQHYFAERAEAVLNPFAAQLLPLEADWLGFSRFINKQPPGSPQWHSGHAMLYSEENGITWVWLRAKLADNAPNPALLTLWQESKTAAEQNGYHFAAAGGALFAADAKQSAERESSWMSAAGLILTFLLLGTVFRSVKTAALLLPLGLGILWGLAATIAVCGEIHALTLVIGTSLIGVLVDFPLHWLAPSLFPNSQPWNGRHTMRQVLPGFAVSFGITALGYLLLWFTPLPILQQTAVFSVAALAGSFSATVFLLPALFHRYRAKPVPFARLTARFADRLPALKWRYILLPLACLSLSGIFKLQWQDDIRSWMVLRPDLLADSRQIARLSGMEHSQTVLLTAPDTDTLLKQNRQLETRLRQHNLAEIQSLNQWILPTDEQIQLRQRFAELAAQPEIYAPLTDIGVPKHEIQTALTAAAQAAPVSLAESLNTPQGEAFRSLYLGNINGRHASLARLHHVRNPAALAAALPDGAVLLDKPAQLNRQFAQTRNQAAWLKLASFVFAWAVLWYIFGKRRGTLMLAVPTLAVIGTLGLLGWLQIPVSLFAVFGMLLAAAIGADYAVYAVTAPEHTAARIAGITLAALTTGISFILLAGSATPAVAAFGISVSCGVVFNWLAAVWLIQKFPHD
ncbi:MMPL family transporter [Neisseria sp. ZJ106]|uniref:MMPL family transporter n=1 Tax=Neisseria lisongii TaxID=2912188 RepID=A0ABY7RLR9_9NEIS|nr:MMPL family transporter [Neisseria lisongii]MCF7521100.1 MMPL family transporter [Neisseria lisongii]WCL72025.1 MMPL family transporter [Neisseria lisongii]